MLTELLISEEQLWQTLVVIGSHDNTLDVLATLLRRHHPQPAVVLGPRGQHRRA